MNAALARLDAEYALGPSRRVDRRPRKQPAAPRRGLRQLLPRWMPGSIRYIEL